jgi:hypothetical protein
MTEDVGARHGEQRFGHIVVQTYYGEVFSLDLFETPDLVCRGYYLPPPDSAPQRGRFPGSPAPEVELKASRGVIEELERTSDIGTRSEQGRLYFEVREASLEVFGELVLVSERSDTGAEVWTGSVFAGQMSFVLERYGSPEIVALITLIFLLITLNRHADALDEDCWLRAREMCGGEQGIKNYKVRRNLMGLGGRLAHDCEIECR